MQRGKISYFEIMVPENDVQSFGTTYHMLGHNEGEDASKTHNEFSRVKCLVEICSSDSRQGNTHV